MPRAPGTMRAKRSATDMTRYFEYGEEEVSYLKAKAMWTLPTQTAIRLPSAWPSR